MVENRTLFLNRCFKSRLKSRDNGSVFNICWQVVVVVPIFNICYFKQVEPTFSRPVLKSQSVSGQTLRDQSAARLKVGELLFQRPRIFLHLAATPDKL